jgi:hypothetical protein
MLSAADLNASKPAPEFQHEAAIIAVSPTAIAFIAIAFPHEAFIAITFPHEAAIAITFPHEAAIPITFPHEAAIAIAFPHEAAIAITFIAIAFLHDAAIAITFPHEAAVIAASRPANIPFIVFIVVPNNLFIIVSSNFYWQPRRPMLLTSAKTSAGFRGKCLFLFRVIRVIRGLSFINACSSFAFFRAFRG